MPDDNEQSPPRPSSSQPWCFQHQSLIEQLREDVKDLQHTLDGNGRPGLKSEMTVMRTQMDTALSLIRWQIATTVGVAAVAVAVVALLTQGA